MKQGYRFFTTTLTVVLIIVTMSGEQESVDYGGTMESLGHTQGQAYVPEKLFRALMCVPNFPP